jgi:curved DNA-binding protein CbpA
MGDRRSSLPPRPAQRVPSVPQLELEAIVPEDQHLVLSWSEALDDADYLALLDLPLPAPGEPGPKEEELRDAFHVFCERFHPDVYPDAPDDVREAAMNVFARGAEAYRVLRNPKLAERYYKLACAGTLRMPPEELARPPESKKPASAREATRTAAAATFAARADELMATGDLKQARLQLQLASMKEPENEDLAEMLRTLEDQLRPRRA